MVVFIMNNPAFYLRIDHGLIRPVFKYGLKILAKFLFQTNWFHQKIYTWQTEWQSSPLPVASSWNISEHNNFLITPQLKSKHTWPLSYFWTKTFSPRIFGEFIFSFSRYISIVGNDLVITYSVSISVEIQKLFVETI